MERKRVECVWREREIVDVYEWERTRKQHRREVAVNGENLDDVLRMWGITPRQRSFDQAN